MRNPVILLLQIQDLMLRGVLVLLQIRDIVRHLAHLELSLLYTLLLVLDRALESFQLVVEAFECSKLVLELCVVAVVCSL